jgi:hypothetical protein
VIDEIPDQYEGTLEVLELDEVPPLKVVGGYADKMIRPAEDKIAVIAYTDATKIAAYLGVTLTSPSADPGRHRGPGRIGLDRHLQRPVLAGSEPHRPTSCTASSATASTLTTCPSPASPASRHERRRSSGSAGRRSTPASTSSSTPPTACC